MVHIQRLETLMHEYITIPASHTEAGIVSFARDVVGIDVDSYDDIQMFLDEYDHDLSFNFNDWVIS